MLYVALTRAREKMLLIADARKDAAKAAAPFVSAGLFPDGETLPRTLTDGELTVPVCYEAYELPENFRYRHNESAASQGTEQDIVRWRAAYDARKARYQKWISEDQLRAPSELADPNLLTEEQRAGGGVGYGVPPGIGINAFAKANARTGCCIGLRQMRRTTQSQRGAGSIVAVCAEFFICRTFRVPGVGV